MTESCLYKGHVRHRRQHPIEHDFRYSMFMVYLDLAELDQVFKHHWLWSTSRFNVAWLRRADHVRRHIGDSESSIDQHVRRLVHKQTGIEHVGPIRMLTHLRYWGYCFNPATFYYCFDPSGSKLVHVVIEVSNTPWREQHYYVLSPEKPVGAFQAKFEKDFYVSPFISMDGHYRLVCRPPEKHLSLHLELSQNDRSVFDATLNFERREITSRNLALTLLRHPWMTVKVTAAIHWQGFQLWRKGASVYSHGAANDR